MKSPLLVLTVLTLWGTPHALADILEFKDGKTLNGKYAGGTAATIRFETSEGIQVIETSQILALTFTGAGASPTAASPAAAPPLAAPPTTATPAAPPASASGPVTIPAGTAILVRLVDAVSSRDAAGKRFTTTLETDLTVNGVVVAKAAKGAVAGAAIGAIVEDDQGAGKGAAIGAVASGLKKGEAVSVSPGTLLEFRLQQPLAVSVSR